ncbi:anion permease [Pantoea ananatis]
MKKLSNVKEPPKAAPAAAGKNKALMLLLPVLVAVLLLLVPVPAGLEPYAWHFFAIFVGVIVGLIFEPLPGAVIGLTGVVVIALFSQFLLLARQNWPTPNLKWQVSHLNGRSAASVTQPSG